MNLNFSVFTAWFKHEVNDVVNKKVCDTTDAYAKDVVAAKKGSEIGA